MMADLIFFIALAIFAIGGAITMVISSNPMHSALGILITMLSVAGMFALLNAIFLFLVQIIVYAGYNNDTYSFYFDVLKYKRRRFTKRT